MLKEISTAIRMLVVLTLVLGVFYPLSMTGFAQLLFSSQANGSLITKDGQVVGSELIGQTFASDAYFNGRPSAAGDDGYDATSSTGSNLGPTSEKLMKSIAERADQVRQDNDLSQTAMVPSDLVMASGSGLDPHISPAAAKLQIARIAKARGLTENQVSALVEKNIENPQLGFLGDKRVNVLQLNLALDAMPL
jgi:K+-transporting ATPase ATPase C chain